MNKITRLMQVMPDNPDLYSLVYAAFYLGRCKICLVPIVNVNYDGDVCIDFSSGAYSVYLKFRKNGIVRCNVTKIMVLTKTIDVQIEDISDAKDIASLIRIIELS